MDKSYFESFIYNCLIHANQLSIIEKSKEAADFLQKTGVVYRYIIKDRAKLPVANELTALDNYLILKKIVQSYQFSIRIDIDEGFPVHCLVNKLSLFEVVESYLNKQDKYSNNDVEIGINYIDNRLKVDIGDGSKVLLSKTIEV